LKEFFFNSDIYRNTKYKST